MKIIKIILLSTILFFTSCKKDKKNPEENCKPTTPSETVYSNYSQLKVGNYWIYQQFTVDSLGNGTPTNVYDSCFVQKDTIINGKVFFKQYRPDIILSWSFVRDSLHYLVNNSGTIVFSSQDFTTIFNSAYNTYYDPISNLKDTIAFITSKMTEKNYIKNTPAGNFNTINFKVNYKIHPPFNNNGMLNRPINTRYALGIGIVSETHLFFLNQTSYTERRLVRYKIN